MCVFLGRAMKIFFGPSLGGAIAPLAPPVDPPLLKPGALLVNYINIVFGANRLCGESSVRRNVLPWGEVSMRRNVRGAKSP